MSTTITLEASQENLQQETFGKRKTWLSQQREAFLHAEIRRYAEQMAGTAADLDTALEAATIEHLLQDEAT